MINSSKFMDRINKILAFYDLPASAFADKIGVQRSSISHLMAGRNKPSLEFVMRVTDTFPDVTLEWLVSGKGSFPAKAPKTAPGPQVEAPTQKAIAPKESTPSSPVAIDKIIIFYSDGSFKAYLPE